MSVYKLIGLLWIDADVSKDAGLSLLEWAHYLLEPHAGIEKK